MHYCTYKCDQKKKIGNCTLIEARRVRLWSSATSPSLNSSEGLTMKIHETKTNKQNKNKNEKIIRCHLHFLPQVMAPPPCYAS